MIFRIWNQIVGIGEGKVLEKPSNRWKHLQASIIAKTGRKYVGKQKPIQLPNHQIPENC